MRFAQIVIIVFQLFNLLSIAQEISMKFIYSIDQLYTIEHDLALPKCYTDSSLFN